LPLPSPATRRLAIAFDDGDNPPLAGVALSLWRRRDVLLFVWPAAGPVRLLAGAPELPTPVYDLAVLGEPLLARDWQPVELDLAGGAPGSEARWWGRWIMPATLLLATVFLLLLLRRILSEGA
jgi:hypothetical protein